MLRTLPPLLDGMPGIPGLPSVQSTPLCCTERCTFPRNLLHTPIVPAAAGACPHMLWHARQMLEPKPDQGGNPQQARGFREPTAGFALPCQVAVSMWSSRCPSPALVKGCLMLGAPHGPRRLEIVVASRGSIAALGTQKEPPRLFKRLSVVGRSGRHLRSLPRSDHHALHTRQRAGCACTDLHQGLCRPLEGQ